MISPMVFFPQQLLFISSQKGDFFPRVAFASFWKILENFNIINLTKEKETPIVRFFFLPNLMVK
jgi:hypothetical protein